MCGEANVEGWNRVKKLFAAKGAAIEDNEEVVWPWLRGQLKQHVHASTPSRPVRVLDFGCGAGQLAHKLGMDGFEVVGLDPASDMISEASKQRTPGVVFRIGTEDDLLSEGSFGAVVSSMVFPFIEDVGRCFDLLSARIVPGGVMSFAVFTTDFVAWLLSREVLFSQKDCCTEMELGGERFSVFARNARQYEEALVSRGFAKVDEDSLVYSGDVPPQNQPEQQAVPRFLVMTFRKSP